MLYTKGLEDLILNKHKSIHSDELIIISGYIGPSPISKLSSLTLNTKVVYGMFGSDSITSALHDKLKTYHSNKNQIYYSGVPVHSKCYIWRKKGVTIYALLGSANFSTNGLTKDDKEILTEVEDSDIANLDNYLSQVLNSSIECTKIPHSLLQNNIAFKQPTGYSCKLELYNPTSNTVPTASGLNWGNSSGNTIPGDAYITIRTKHIKNFPYLFPPKRVDATKIGKSVVKKNEPIELIWDDGMVMEALLEGTQNFSGFTYPKQLSSSPQKNTLGIYLRKRLGISSRSVTITKADLDKYGRNYITITPLQQGVYFMDFSV